MACGDFSRESYRKRLTQGTFVSAETATGGVLWKKVFSNISQNSYENTCAIFLWNLRTFKNNFFKEHLLGDCFCKWIYTFFISSPPVVLLENVAEIWNKFTGEHVCWSVILIKLRSNFIKITLSLRCSLVKLLHIFRKPFPRNTSGGLLLFIKD